MNRFSLQNFWVQRGFVNRLLLPLSWLFSKIVALRRWVYRQAWCAPKKCSVPVVVVGNVVVGGSGKTPFVIALVKALQVQGWKPGIISRGYGGRRCQAVLLVEATTHWRQCGDEALLLHSQTGVPVCVATRRFLAARALCGQGCDIIISDDGLQHYELHRDIEICVMNTRYRFGNGWFLPAGPLREGVSRFQNSDIQVAIGEGDCPETCFPVSMEYGDLVAVNDSSARDFVVQSDCVGQSDFIGKSLVAFAGIAHPQYFFSTLEKLGLTLKERYPLSDHGTFSLIQLKALEGDILITTEKDGVKYRGMDDRLYVLPMRCLLPLNLTEVLNNRLRIILDQKKNG